MSIFYYITPIELATLFISLSSIALTIYIGRATQIHNRLSVKPKLQIDGFYNAEAECGLSLYNAGLGPAIIDDIKYYFDGELLSDDKFRNQFDANVLFNKMGIGGASFTVVNFFLGEVIPMGKTIHIFKETSPRVTPKNTRETFIVVAQRIRIEIVYRSLYDEIFHYKYPH